MHTRKRNRKTTGKGKGHDATGNAIKPSKAGMGRPKGVPNKITKTIRDMFAAFVTCNVPKMQMLFDKVAKQDPARALMLITQFAEYCIPKLGRVEIQTPPESSLPTNPIRNAEEAASVYMQVLGDPRLDLGALTFNPVVAVQEHVTASPPLESEPTDLPAPTTPTSTTPPNNPEAPAESNVVGLWSRLGQ
jgi:hypothetical protein